MLFMISWSRLSTSSRDQESLMLFCDISRPDVATPPAFATLPLPETRQFFPLRVSRRVVSISDAKYTAPYPVASGRISDPPQLSPFPVRTPLNSFRSRLY